MGYGLWKAHHGIMKSTAIGDYNLVKKVCEEAGLPVIEPSRKHWHKIEDATAQMFNSLGELRNSIKTWRGNDYYVGIFKTMVTSQTNE
jgi:hypothetical protein